MKGKLEILYQDKDFIILNKPAGVLSIPDRFVPEKPNLVDFLKKQFERIWIVHRLDKETSGAICFALNPETHQALSIQFEKREVEKIYWALVEGNPQAESGEISRGIAPHPTIAGKMMPSSKGKKALTFYQTVKLYKKFSLLSADIKTGRTHQVRVHFSSIGHPLVVDALYGKRKALNLSEIKGRNYRLGKAQEERPLMSRLSLHARSLSLIHPQSGTPITVEAPLPKDFRAVLKQLDKWG